MEKSRFAIDHEKQMKSRENSVLKLSMPEFPEQPTHHAGSITSVLEKSADKRTKDEIELLVVLIKNLNFFKEREIKEKYYPEIVSWLKLQKFSADETVFEKGSIGETFYIIIKGSVKVLGPNKNKFDKIK